MIPDKTGFKDKGEGGKPRSGGGRPPRNRDMDAGGGRTPGGPGGRRFGRRKFCRFSAEGMEYIDYKNYRLLRELLTERGKIKPRGQTGTTAKFQRMLTTAVKRARQMALLSSTKL